MDTLQALRTGEKMFVAAGLLIAIACLFPWYSLTEGSVTLPLRPWDLGVVALIPILIATASACLLIVTRVGRPTLPGLRLPWKKILLWGAAISDTLFGVQIAVITQTPNLSLELGYYLAAIGGILWFYGAWVLEDEF
jgi:hypothetical protein